MSEIITANEVEKKATLFSRYHGMKWLIGLNFAVTLCAILFAWWIHFKQPHFVTFDIKGTTDSFLKQLEQTSLNEEEKIKRVKRFEQTLRMTVSEYRNENVVIFVKAAVVSDLPDKTVEIKRKIAMRIKQQEDF